MIPVSRRDSQTGFTLMEVMIAMAISAMIMTAVLGSLDYTQRAVDAIHNIVETENAGPRIMEHIRQDLSSLAVRDAENYRVLKGVNGIQGGADADRIDFLARRHSFWATKDWRSDRMLHAPLVEVGYMLRPHPRYPEFLELYRREDFLFDDEPFQDGDYSLMYDRVIHFDIRYYEEPAYDPNWEEDWDSEEREALPYAIEVQLELEVQPRRSLESLGILGANRSRLLFDDWFTIPDSTRWVFRNRLHPTLTGTESTSGESNPLDPDQAEDGANATGGTTTTINGGMSGFGAGRSERGRGETSRGESPRSVGTQTR